MKIWNVGYPRAGLNNDWFPKVRSYEMGTCSEEELLEMGRGIILERWKTQHELGIDSIPINDFTVWDSVLDTAWLFNLMPLKITGQNHWLSDQLSLIRGNSEKNIRPLNQVSWYRTPYRFFQPEWDGKTALSLNREKLDWELKTYKGLPYQFHVTLIGPWSLANLTKTTGRTRAELLKELTPLYVELLKDFKKKGFEWVQFEEPGFCVDLQKDDIKIIATMYESFKGPLPKILIATYYDSPDPWLTELSQLPVQGLHYDLVAGPAVLSWIKTRSFPKDKILGLGLVDATNVWAASVTSLYKQIELLKGFHPPSKILLSPSSSMLHLPVTKQNENKLKESPDLFENISFANERVEELALLKQIILGNVNLADVEKKEGKRRERMTLLQKRSDSVRNQINRMDFSFRKRASSFAKRSKAQSKRMMLPRLPVTVVQDRGCKVDIPILESLNYEDRIQEYASRWVGIVPTEAGWIQKVGSACVRPPIIVSDIEWKKRNQDDSERTPWKPGEPPYKSVALGPVSLVNQSFVRQDLPREQVVLQAALAVRNEIKLLESSGAPVVQIDEPALTDLVPLKKQKLTVYLKHQMDNLKVASCGAKDETVICLNIDNSELPVLADLLPKSDVDVLSFSSGGNLSEKLIVLKGMNMECGVAPGVAGQRDEIIPTEKEIETNIRKSFEVIAPEKLWVSIDTAFRELSQEYVQETVHRVIAVTERIRRLLTGKN